MPAEVTPLTDKDKVALTFTYEEYAFTAEEAERVGKELIQAAGQTSQE